MDRKERNRENALGATEDRPPDRGYRPPKLSWKRILRPGVSGAMMIGLFLGTLLILGAAAFLVKHQ
jgi:hypothetical protein